MAASSASASSGAAFVTPHKSRPSTHNAANTGSTESSMSSTSTTTPTPTRYLPLLREIQDIQEMTANSLNTSKAVFEVSTRGVSDSSSTTATRVEARPTTMNSSFSFGVF